MSDDPVLYGYTIFCDDIRLEASGKNTFVGVYENVMYVHGEFPFLLPKFAMAVRYLEKRGVFTDEEVTLHIFLPGDDEDTPSVQGALQAREARETVRAHPDAETTPGEARYLRIATDIVLSPLVIQKAGVFKVRVQCGTKIGKLGTLLVTAKPPDAT